MYTTARKLARLAAAVVAIGALAGCDIAVNGDGGFHFDVAAGKAQDEWTRTYQMKQGGRLELINVNGGITARASDGTAVELRAERTAKGLNDDGARDLLRRIEMREEVGEGRVRVEVRPPRITGPSGHEVKWTIDIPRGVAVDLRTINGTVTMTGLQGDIRARSTNGKITGNAIAANAVDAAVTNGGVEIELAHAVTAGTFDLEAVNGGVALNLPSESKADIAARCVNGGISVEGLDVEVSGSDDERERTGGEVTRKFRRRLDGQLNGGGARVSMETVNGGVRIGAATGQGSGIRD